MKVTLYVYDLSMGIAKQLSQQFTGKQFDGIYHTGIVVEGVEYFFGGGIQKLAAGMTPYGTPIRKVELGNTEKTREQFEEWVKNMGDTKYRLDNYDLFTNNCNNFTQDAAQFLVNQNIPDDIRNLPQEFFETPMGQMIRPMVDQMMGGVRQQQQQQQQQNPYQQQQQQQNPYQQQQQGNPFQQMMNNNTMPNMGEMMNNPMVQQMMNNPEMMRQALEMSGMGNHPMAQQMLNNPQMMRDMMSNPMVQQMMNNPQMMQQMMNNNQMGGGFQQQQQPRGPTGPVYNPYARQDPPKTTTSSTSIDSGKIFRIGTIKVTNIPKIIKKLQDTISQENIEMTTSLDTTLSNLSTFLAASSSSKPMTLLTPTLFANLGMLMEKMSEKNVFPVLDIFRLLVVTNQVAKRECSPQGTCLSIIESRFVSHWDSLSMPTQLMVLRIYCNLFCESAALEKQQGCALSYIRDENRYNRLAEIATASLTSPLEGIRLSATSLAANLAYFAQRDGNDEETQLLCSMMTYVVDESSEKVVQRMLLTIYRLVLDNPDAASLIRSVYSGVLNSVSHKNSKVVPSLIAAILKRVHSL